MKCNKRSYPNKLIAEQALIQARIRFETNNAISVYDCSECGEWHLSSKGEVNPNLKAMIDSGELNEEIKKSKWEHLYK